MNCLPACCCLSKNATWHFKVSWFVLNKIITFDWCCKVYSWSGKLCTFWMIVIYYFKIDMFFHLCKVLVKMRAATFQMKLLNLPGNWKSVCNLAAAGFILCAICLNGSRDSPALHCGNISCLPQNRFELLLTKAEVHEKVWCGITVKLSFVLLVRTLTEQTNWTMNLFYLVF